MTKEESKIMQGVAILMMMYLHLFNNINNVELCNTYFYIENTPLIYIMTRASSPVAFFVILSGYGLYTVEKKNNKYNIILKLKKLYIHYWISLVLFVPMAALIVGVNKYPGSLQNVVENVTAWHTTWNGEIWFFFPYLLLALSSRCLFKLMDRINIWVFMSTSLIFSFAASFSISRFGDAYFYYHQLPYMPLLYFNLLFAFIAGAWMAKYNIVEKIKLKIESVDISKQLIWLIIVLLIALRCCLDTGAFHDFYAIIFILLFVNAPRWKLIDKFLTEIGKRSTSIWFVHTYFCYYIFHDFIFSFKYPIIIFLVLLACSYMSAAVIDRINKRVLVLIK